MTRDRRIPRSSFLWQQILKESSAPSGGQVRSVTRVFYCSAIARKVGPAALLLSRLFRIERGWFDYEVFSPGWLPGVSLKVE